MPYRQNLDTGEWIEVDAQGNPVAPAPSPAAPIVVGKPKPKERKEPKTSYRAMTAEEMAAAGLPPGTVAQISSEGKIDVVSKPDAGTVHLSPEDRAEVAAEARQKIQLIDSLIARSKNGWFATGFGAGTASMIPGTTARDVAQDVQTVGASGALQRIMEMARNNGGKNPLTPLSNADFQALGQSIANLDPSQSDEQFQRNLKVYRDIYQRALTAAGGDAQDQKADEQRDEAPPSPLQAGGNDDGGPAQTIARGPTRAETDPRVNSLVNGLMNAGASKAMIDAALAERNIPPISYAEYAAAKKWMQANPGKRYTGTNATREVPLSMLERAAGSGLGAGVAHYANTAGAGIPAALAGERGKGALDAMADANPGETTAGQILGGVTGALGAELGVAAQAPAAVARFAPRIGDALFGGLTGFNAAEEGEGLTGAATGALTAVAGGQLGDWAMRGVSAAFRGVTDPAVQRLREAGIPMTVGQVIGNGGVLGRSAKKVEDALTGTPGVGNMIEARRMEGLEAFNRAAFNVGAEGTGNQIENIGAAGVDDMRAAVRAAYADALDPVTIKVDDEALVNDLGATIAAARRIPNVDGAQDAAMASLQARIEGAIDPATDEMTGRGFQEAYRGLARTGRERANRDYGYEVGQVMRQGQDALAGALERQNGGAFDAFLAANAANRRANVLADAVKSASNQERQMFTPAQINRADVNSTNKLEGKIAAAGLDRPFYELATAGQEVLPSKVPDSGTWTRALTGAGITGLMGGGGAIAGGPEGAGAGAGIGLGVAGLAMLGGTRTGQRVLTELLLERPAWARTLADTIQRNAYLGGGLGSGVLTPLVVSP